MPHAGKVYLVGAGPGDPGLFTLRGRECLLQADLILYDGLVNPLILDPLGGVAERTCRTDGPAGRVLPQAEINARLIAAARDGKTVVRLKGGDPFVFGRGSEEAAALRAAGIEFEVVPGVTAAVAASAYAGISVTHRDHASAVAFVTGHQDPSKAELLDYDSLARFPGTLVFYMGLHRLPAIVSALLAAGKHPETPAAVISRGTTPLQRTIAAPLHNLPAHVAEARLHAPSMIIIGECVTLRQQLAWFELRPLFGCRIGIPRAAEQAAPIAARCLELGAQPVLMPLIEIASVSDLAPLDAALDRLATYAWLVFTSPNAVSAVLRRLWDRGADPRTLAPLRIAAIGPGTAAALEAFHLRADLVPPEFRGEAFAQALLPQVAGKRLLWPRASRGRDVLPQMLRAGGAHLDELVVYQNRDAAALSEPVVAALAAGELDWIALSSPSIARGLARLLPPAARDQLGTRLRLASISPVTSAAAREAGLPIHAEAAISTWDGLLDAIARHVAPAHPESRA